MPRRKSLQRARNRAFQHQQGCCHYCSQPMWLRDAEPFRRKYGLTLAQANRFKCTAEHLAARRDGGGDGAANIVAACLHCNSTRHKRRVPPEPATYRDYVLQRVARGRWHQPCVLEAIQAVPARQN